MKPLFLILKTPWFFLIASGDKTVEYREATPYWSKRLLDYRECCAFKCHQPRVIFQHGYAADALRIEADITSIRLRGDYYEIAIANVREERR